MKKTSLLMKNNFVSKVSNLDVLIADKEKKIGELNEEISNKQQDIDELCIKIDNLKNSVKSKESGDVLLPKYSDFEDEDMLINYKNIRENFNFDAKKIIEEFVSKHKDDGMQYDNLIRIKKYFNYDVVYKLSSFNSKEQLEIVLELVNEKEQEMIKPLLLREKFDIRKFLHDLDELIIKSSPQIIVYVGNKNVSYNNISNNIETRYDEKITEGFKIFYKGVVYDYSI